MSVRGGHNLKRTIERAKGAKGLDRVTVGFYETARYPDGTPVAAVAAWNEFGTSRSPERPFFRRTIEAVRETARELIREGTDGHTLVVDRALGDRLGMYVAGELQQEIVNLQEPPNAPFTIAMKGSSNPLVDTGAMRQAVTWETE